jgi:hypothetical protein
MSRNVVVDQSAAAMLDNHKHIQQTEGRGNGNEEIGRGSDQDSAYTLEVTSSEGLARVNHIDTSSGR